MTINVERDLELIVLEISGRLDATTAPNLERIVNDLKEDIKELLFDMSELEYISLEGVRVLLQAHNKMLSNQGVMRIKKANEVLDVLEKTMLLKMLEQE